MNKDYLYVMFRLKKEEKELLDKKLKELKLSRRKFILKCLKGDK